jgi:predicted secreted Zn-dependent protease
MTHYALVAVLALLFAPRAAEKVKWYDVSGKTVQELRASLDASGPKDENGKPFDGYTHWFVRWEYLFSSAADRCQVTSVTTSVEVTTTLPRWTAGRVNGSDLAARWDRYVAALTQHEAAHSDIGKRATATIERALWRVPPQLQCPMLETVLNQTAAELLADARKEERKYDETTRHGETQGAVFR